MHNLIHQFLDSIDSLKEGVDKNSERILKGIDLERMLDNPRTYLKAMAKAFYEAHSTELLEAIDIGKSHARDIIGKSDKD